VCSLYNKDCKDQFKEAYEEQWKRFGLRNVSEVMKAGANPQFVLEEDGPYLLLQDSDVIWIGVPKPDLVLSAKFHTAMSKMFSINGFAQGYRYRKLQLVSPAKFMHDNTRLEFQDRGCITVSDPEIDE
jgi:hypothetical protein